MGLLDFLWGLFGGKTKPARSNPERSPARHGDTGSPDVAPRKKKFRKPSLVPLRRRASKSFRRTPLSELTVPELPYRFARIGVIGGFLDLSRDGDDARLASFGLPSFRTPQELADWLGMPLGRLAWLTHRCEEGQRPRDERHAHYHYRWVKKRSGGYRLIESPKPLLKAAQDKILREILDAVPAHPAAHGFVRGRSIRTNAVPHVGRRVVLKLDLENFFATVGFSRVVAIFRSLGYSREAAIWLASLTTSTLPNQMAPPDGSFVRAFTENALWRYRARHLPQGAPTSPALANLSAFALDLRLAGLARVFHAGYTRYADDLTFSGPARFLGSLRVFLPLIRKIIHGEQFRLHDGKRKVMRDNRQQRVTGVVVNARAGVSRRDFDRLKATLTNCIRRGASTQNHDRHADFAGHLRGRIAHVLHINPMQGQKLLNLYAQIDWGS